jgi:hypothetical protein
MLLTSLRRSFFGFLLRNSIAEASVIGSIILMVGNGVCGLIWFSMCGSLFMNAGLEVVGGL